VPRQLDRTTRPATTGSSVLDKLESACAASGFTWAVLLVEFAARRLRAPTVPAAPVRPYPRASRPHRRGSHRGLGFANDGYFPVAWGWSGLALLSHAATTLALGIAVELSVRELLFLGALAGLTVWMSLSLLWTSSVPVTVLEVGRSCISPRASPASCCSAAARYPPRSSSPSGRRSPSSPT
jgi:hypothetical protein